LFCIERFVGEVDIHTNLVVGIDSVYGYFPRFNIYMGILTFFLLIFKINPL